jgi:hypothetical protein
MRYFGNSRRNPNRKFFEPDKSAAIRYGASEMTRADVLICPP